VLPVSEGDKEWYLYAARAGLPIGVANHRSFVSLSTIARREGSDKSARAATIFIHNGAPQALVGSQGGNRGEVGGLFGERVYGDLMIADGGRARRRRLAALGVFCGSGDGGRF
jgi:hypothetical protein